MGIAARAAFTIVNLPERSISLAFHMGSLAAVLSTNGSI
jgi:hypothetical protein